MDKVKYRMFLVKHGLRTENVAKSMKMTGNTLNRRIRMNILNAGEIEDLVAASGMSKDEFLDIFYPETKL